MAHDPADDTLLRQILQQAADRFYANLNSALPRTAPLIAARLKRVPAGARTVEVCLATQSFPAFSMPWWITPPEARGHDPEFQQDLCYSTLNGYYFVRLIDNVQDGDGPADLRQLLPAGGYFHAQFQSPYQRWFPADHPFWATFQAAWNEQAEAAAVEAELVEIDLPAFLSVSALKFGAAKGPLAAAAYRYGREAELPAWFAFVDRLGALSQLANDLFDWHHDSLAGINTYIQSEYRRRRGGPDETIHRWIMREGFELGAAQIRDWHRDLQAMAAALGAPEATLWLERRGALLEREISSGRAALTALRELADAMRVP
ncbi:MAG TPA: hypothetical protein VFE64_04450 [Devosia sp.]|jgi:hypothetical protein|nr:hypothetical protein [Devosia sp.]